MTDCSTPADTHPALLAALAGVVPLLGGPDFGALDAAGLNRRLVYVKGLLAAVQVVTLLEPDFPDWASVSQALSRPFPGGGTGTDRLSAVLTPGVAKAKENMMVAMGSDSWTSPADALAAISRAMLIIAATPPPSASPPVSALTPGDVAAHSGSGGRRNSSLLQLPASRER